MGLFERSSTTSDERVTKWCVKCHICDGRILHAYEIAEQIFPSFWFHSPPTDDSFIIYSAEH